MNFADLSKSVSGIISSYESAKTRELTTVTVDLTDGIRTMFRQKPPGFASPIADKDLNLARASGKVVNNYLRSHMFAKTIANMEIKVGTHPSIKWVKPTSPISGSELKLAINAQASTADALKPANQDLEFYNKDLEDALAFLEGLPLGSSEETSKTARARVSVAELNYSTHVAPYNEAMLKVNALMQVQKNGLKVPNLLPGTPSIVYKIRTSDQQLPKAVADALRQISHYAEIYNFEHAKLWWKVNEKFLKQTSDSSGVITYVPVYFTSAEEAEFKKPQGVGKITADMWTRYWFIDSWNAFLVKEKQIVLPKYGKYDSSKNKHPGGSHSGTTGQVYETKVPKSSGATTHTCVSKGCDVVVPESNQFCPRHKWTPQSPKLPITKPELSSFESNPFNRRIIDCSCGCNSAVCFKLTTPGLNVQDGIGPKGVGFCCACSTGRGCQDNHFWCDDCPEGENPLSVTATTCGVDKCPNTAFASDKTSYTSLPFCPWHICVMNLVGGMCKKQALQPPYGLCEDHVTEEISAEAALLLIPEEKEPEFSPPSPGGYEPCEREYCSEQSVKAGMCAYHICSQCVRVDVVLIDDVASPMATYCPDHVPRELTRCHHCLFVVAPWHPKFCESHACGVFTKDINKGNVACLNQATVEDSDYEKRCDEHNIDKNAVRLSHCKPCFLAKGPYVRPTSPPKSKQTKSKGPKTPKVCSVSTCENVAVSDGLCASCNASLEKAANKTKNFCSAEFCFVEIAATESYCKTHRTAIKPNKTSDKKKICGEKSCRNQAGKTGFCRRHLPTEQETGPKPEVKTSAEDSKAGLVDCFCSDTRFHKGQCPNKSLRFVPRDPPELIPTARNLGISEIVIKSCAFCLTICTTCHEYLCACSCPVPELGPTATSLYFDVGKPDEPSDSFICPEGASTHLTTEETLLRATLPEELGAEAAQDKKWIVYFNVLAQRTNFDERVIKTKDVSGSTPKSKPDPKGKRFCKSLAVEGGKTQCEALVINPKSTFCAKHTCTAMSCYKQSFGFYCNTHTCKNGCFDQAIKDRLCRSCATIAGTSGRSRRQKPSTEPRRDPPRRGDPVCSHEEFTDNVAAQTRTCKKCKETKPVVFKCGKCKKLADRIIQLNGKSVYSCKSCVPAPDPRDAEIASLRALIETLTATIKSLEEKISGSSSQTKLCSTCGTTPVKKGSICTGCKAFADAEAKRNKCSKCRKPVVPGTTLCTTHTPKPRTPTPPVVSTCETCGKTPKKGTSFCKAHTPKPSEVIGCKVCGSKNPFHTCSSTCYTCGKAAETGKDFCPHCTQARQNSGLPISITLNGVCRRCKSPTIILACILGKCPLATTKPKPTSFSCMAPSCKNTVAGEDTLCKSCKKKAKQGKSSRPTCGCGNNVGADGFCKNCRPKTTSVPVRGSKDGKKGSNPIQNRVVSSDASVLKHFSVYTGETETDRESVPRWFVRLVSSSIPRDKLTNLLESGEVNKDNWQKFAMGPTPSLAEIRTKWSALKKKNSGVALVHQPNNAQEAYFLDGWRRLKKQETRLGVKKSILPVPGWGKGRPAGTLKKGRQSRPSGGNTSKPNPTELGGLMENLQKSFLTAVTNAFSNVRVTLS